MWREGLLAQSVMQFRTWPRMTESYGDTVAMAVVRVLSGDSMRSLELFLSGLWS